MTKKIETYSLKFLMTFFSLVIAPFTQSNSRSVPHFAPPLHYLFFFIFPTFFTQYLSQFWVFCAPSLGFAWGRPPSSAPSLCHCTRQPFFSRMSCTKHHNIVGRFIIVRISYCFVSMYSYVL